MIRDRLLLGGLALAACAEAPAPTPARRLRPCEGDAYVYVVVLDSLTRAPLESVRVDALESRCHAVVLRDGALLGPLPPGAHTIRASGIGVGGRNVPVTAVSNDTIEVHVAVPQFSGEVFIAGTESYADPGTTQPPDTITASWLVQNGGMGCIEGCHGPYIDRIWRQIGGRADARAALLEVIASPQHVGLTRSHAIGHLTYLRPIPYDVIARLLNDPDSLSARFSLVRACSARADSMIAWRNLRPYHRRIDCGASLGEAVPGVHGTYVADLPCFDCDSVRLELSLDTAGTFALRAQYFGLGESLTYGTWLPEQFGNGLSLMHDDGSGWQVVVSDSTTLRFGNYETLPHTLRRVSGEIAPSRSPCRAPRHKGGFVRVLVLEKGRPAEGLPADARLRTTRDGCTAVLRPSRFDGHYARIGPLAPGAHEVVVESSGRLITTDTINAYAGHTIHEAIQLD